MKKGLESLLKTVLCTTVLVIGFCSLCLANDKKIVNEVSTQFIEMSIQGVPLTIDTKIDKGCQETTIMTTEFPMDFKMGEYSGWDIRINDVGVESDKTTKIKIDKLDKDIAVIIKLKNINTGKQIEHYIRTLPLGVKDVTVLGSVNNGVYYYADTDYAFKMNHKGEIIFYYAAHSIADFKKNVIDGKTYYSMLTSNISHKYPPMGVGVGPNAKAVIMDSNYYVIDTVPELLKTKRTPEGIPLDGHGIKMLGLNHYLVVGYVPERVENVPDSVPHSKFGTRVVASVIQEIKDDKVVMEWHSNDFPEFYKYSILDDYFNKQDAWLDYMHWNSIDVDPEDNNIICSFRHNSSEVKIDRVTGEIIWILGGKGDQFNLQDNQKTVFQHDARILGDGWYSVFDNGDGLSRVVEYRIDEKEKKLIDFKEYYLENQFSVFAGNAQKQPGTKARYVIGWGGFHGGNALFSDIDFETGKVLFEVVRIIEDGSFEHVYRAYRFDS